MPDFRRRHLLGAALAAAVLPLPLPAAVPLPAPAAARIRRPRAGLVEVELEAQVATVDVDGQPAQLWAYDGILPGPLIEARAGDTIRLRFTNRLPEPTNFHFHGRRATATMSG